MSVPRLLTRTQERQRRVEFSVRSEGSREGVFEVRPLERGFGHTLGNALRRVLLSSIVGSAVTSVTIEGVEHEFSTLTGVVEDVTEIILNIRSIRLKILGGGTKTLTLERSGAGVITTGHIQTPENVLILNPDQVIATLDSPEARLAIRMEARRGRGFQPAEEILLEDRKPGVIPLDADFSPIRKVAYRVEPTRVGQRTDYDKLILEVSTDGSISPDDAVGQAARILTDHLRLFVTFEGSDEVVEEAADAGEDKMRKLLAMPVDELELSVRSSNCLKAANLRRLGELVIRSDSEMLKYRNFGKKSLLEIKEKLSEYGLTLGMKEVAHLVDGGGR